MAKKTLAEWRASSPLRPVRASEGLEPVYIHIGSVIREMRLRHGYTLSEVAEKLDVSPTSISNIESGNQRIAIHDLVSIANVLEVPAIDLLPEGYLE